MIEIMEEVRKRERELEMIWRVYLEFLEQSFLSCSSRIGDFGS